MSDVVNVIPDDSTFQPAYLPRNPFDAPRNPYVTVLRFREDFPEFSDASVYHNQIVQFFLDIAGIAVLPRFWCQFTVYGQELYTAHMLAVRQYAIARAAASPGSGAVPGMPMGLPASKSVSKVSVSYDFGKSTMEGWGPWNTTVYGQMYAWHAQLVGTGGYETLSVGYEGSLAGRVLSWTHGVLMGYYGSTG